jgi:ABC-type phosphate transport system substrate-binding protein
MRKPLLALLLLISSARAEVAVIANSRSGLDALTAKQVQDIFLGRTRTFPDGRYALPVDQSPLRAEFYQKLTSRPVEQINAYWARIMFTGQASPPLQLPDDAAVLKTIRENEGAIGYVDKSRLDKTVRVLLLLN